MTHLPAYVEATLKECMRKYPVANRGSLRQVTQKEGELSSVSGCGLNCVLVSFCVLCAMWYVRFALCILFFWVDVTWIFTHAMLVTHRPTWYFLINRYFSGFTIPLSLLNKPIAAAPGAPSAKYTTFTEDVHIPQHAWIGTYWWVSVMLFVVWDDLFVLYCVWSFDILSWCIKVTVYCSPSKSINFYCSIFSMNMQTSKSNWGERAMDFLPQRWLPGYTYTGEKITAAESDG